MKEKSTIAMAIMSSGFPKVLLDDIDKLTEITCLWKTTIKIHIFNDESTVLEVVMSDGQSRYHSVW